MHCVLLNVAANRLTWSLPTPPYALKELGELPDRVMKGKIVAEDGLFVLEHGKDYDFSNHPDFIEHRAYGSVNFSFFRHSHHVHHDGNEMPANDVCTPEEP